MGACSDSTPEVAQDMSARSGGRRAGGARAAHHCDVGAVSSWTRKSASALMSST